MITWLFTQTCFFLGLDYYETIICLEDAIETASCRPGDVSPSRFCEKVEKDLESIRRAEEMSRRGILEGCQEKESGPDNDD
jgi:hypothetical protein